MISKFQYMVLRHLYNNEKCLISILDELDIKELEFDKINALYNLVVDEYIIYNVGDGAFLKLTDFETKYNVKRNHKLWNRRLVEHFGSRHFITSNKGVVAIEEYERIINRDQRDVKKIDQNKNSNVISWFAFIISIAAFIINFIINWERIFPN